MANSATFVLLYIGLGAFCNFGNKPAHLAQGGKFLVQPLGLSATKQILHQCARFFEPPELLKALASLVNSVFVLRLGVDAKNAL